MVYGCPLRCILFASTTFLTILTVQPSSTQLERLFLLWGLRAANRFQRKFVPCTYVHCVFSNPFPLIWPRGLYADITYFHALVRPVCTNWKFQKNTISVRNAVLFLGCIDTILTKFGRSHHHWKTMQANEVLLKERNRQMKHGDWRAPISDTSLPIYQAKRQLMERIQTT